MTTDTLHESNAWYAADAYVEALYEARMDEYYADRYADYIEDGGEDDYEDWAIGHVSYPERLEG